MKKKETIALENALNKQTIEKRLYGCEEITIGFYSKGHGDEIVDYMTMDSKGIIKCYELKVSLSDLKSKAKKSWYGHYNYLVVSSELYDKVEDWSLYIPSHVGIIVGKDLVSKRKAKYVDISKEDAIMLKESMIRSMWWKMQKYKDAKSLDVQKNLKKEISRLKKEKDMYYDLYREYSLMVSKYEIYVSSNRGTDFVLADEVEKEKKKYAERKGRRS